jgi:hypothetical protein
MDAGTVFAAGVVRIGTQRVRAPSAGKREAFHMKRLLS